MLTLISLTKFVQKFKSRSSRTRRQRDRQILQPLEALESRAMLAATLGGISTADPGADTATFLDASGDQVTVRVSGGSGTATFQDADGGTVDDGDDIFSVVISGASSDFTLTYSFDASGDVADDPDTVDEDETFDSDDTVAMGNITSNRSIRGVFTVPLSTEDGLQGIFNLVGFAGPGFSLHGSLNADNLIGGSDGGIDLSSLGSNRALNFRGNIDADILIRGGLDGTIAFGDGVSADSDLTVRGAVGRSGAIAGNGDFLGTATFFGSFSGKVTIDGDVGQTEDGEVIGEVIGGWTFRSTVSSTASLQADQWINVDALRDFGGTLLATDGDITLSVGGNLARTANLVADDDTVLEVNRSILSGARISGSGDLTATVGGNDSGTIVMDGDVTLDVAGSLSNATIVGDDGDFVIGRGIRNSSASFSDGLEIVVLRNGVTNSRLNANDDLSIDVTGNVTGSQLTGENTDSTVVISGNLVNSQVNSGSEDLTLNVGGNIINSQVVSDESEITVTVGGSVTRSTLSSSDGGTVTIGRDLSSSNIITLNTDVTITVGGNVSNSSITGSEITLAITGSLTNSQVTADEGDLSISTGMDVNRSTITAIDTDITLNVGRDLIRSTVESTDSDVTVNVTRHMTNSSITADSDVTLNVGGNMTNSSAISSESDIEATVGGNFTNSSLTADETIELEVEGNASGTITSFDGDVTLNVGGTFTGTVIADDDLLAKLGGLNGTLNSNGLDLFVDGNVSSRSVIQTNQVTDLDDDDDNIGFRVEGTFAGALTAVQFDSNQAIVDQNNLLVVGDVLSTAKINIGAFNGDVGETYEFGGRYRGHLSIASALNMNLLFGGDVHHIAIGGSVGIPDENGVVTITVDGRLNFLSSNSFFIPTEDGDGDFRDGDGNLTGELITNGFSTVIPRGTFDT